MDFTELFMLTPANCIGAGLILVLGLGYSAYLLFGFRSQIYVGVTPGDLPMGPGDAQVRPGRHGRVPIQFSPPADLEPAEAELLERGKVTSRSIAGSLLRLLIEEFVERLDANRLRATSKVGRIGAGEPIGWFTGQIAMALTDDHQPVVDPDHLARSAKAASRVSLARQRLAEQAYDPKGWYPTGYKKARSIGAVLATVLGLAGGAPFYLLALQGSDFLWGVDAAMIGIPLGLPFLAVVVLAVVLKLRRYRTSVSFWFYVGGAAVITAPISLAAVGLALPNPDSALPLWQIIIAVVVCLGICLIYPFFLIAGLVGYRVALMIFGSMLWAAPAVAMVWTYGLGYWALALVLSSLLLGLALRRRPPLSADGSAALARARGFKDYLMGVDIGQLRHEAGEEVFTSYLPWALVFDQRNRWTPFISSVMTIGAKAEKTGWFDDSDPNEPSHPRVLEPMASPTRGLLEDAEAMDNAARPGQVFIHKLGPKKNRITASA